MQTRRHHRDGWVVSIAFLAALAHAAIPAKAQAIDPPATALGVYANLPVKICGKRGVQHVAANLPSIGCFALAPGAHAAGTFEEHQFVVEVDAAGMERCRLDEKASQCDGCVVKGAVECSTTLTVLSRDADRTVVFYFARKIRDRAYVTNQENWDFEQKRVRDGGDPKQLVPR